MGRLNVAPRTIFCRDNLDILQGINSECIDLIYLDPPFNKNKVFTAQIGSSAEGAEFSDIFREEDIKDEWVKNIEYESPELYAYLLGIKVSSSKYNYCYLVYMAIRLIECRRILKGAGSIYLHCDPTMSHYLKSVLDCIFSEKNFRNEIVWCYHGPGSPQMKQFNRKHDIILWYAKSAKWTFNKDDIRIPFKDPKQSLRGAMSTDGTFTEEEIEKYRKKGKIPETWWEMRIAARSKKEYVGYPTQKPLMLLERIIKASSKEGDIVLDPFCGCATTCVAAEKWNRKWIGVDISQKAYELVNMRLQSIYDEQSKTSTTFPLLSGGYIEANFTTTPPLLGRDVKQEQGYVYIISNDSWGGIYKVGIAKNPQNRLASYQTSDPYRAYKLLYSHKTPHYKDIEQFIHNTFQAAGEWIEGEFAQIKKAIRDKDKKLRA